MPLRLDAGGQEADDRETGQRLAAARFADDADVLAAVDEELDPADDRRGAVGPRDPHRQASNIHEAPGGLRRSCGFERIGVQSGSLGHQLEETLLAAGAPLPPSRW